MIDTSNPYESPTKTGQSPLAEMRAEGSTRTRMGVLAFNTILLGLFPPICCPCGFGPIGFIIQPYMMLLGVPSIFLSIAIPQMRTGNELIFLSLYVTNYVLMSYGLGALVDRFRQRRRLIQRANHAMQRSGGGDVSDNGESTPAAR